MSALPHEVENIIQLAIEGIVKGYPNSELIPIIKGSFPHVEEDEIGKCIRQGMGLIKERTLVDIDKIIPQHIELYEKLYQEFVAINYIPGKIKAMKGKEKVVGLHRENNYIEVVNEVNVEMEVESEYDLSKLTDHEKKRLEELMNKVAKVK